jgi:hypothetical protein
MDFVLLMDDVDISLAGTAGVPVAQQELHTSTSIPQHRHCALPRTEINRAWQASMKKGPIFTSAQSLKVSGRVLDPALQLSDTWHSPSRWSSSPLLFLITQHRTAVSYTLSGADSLTCMTYAVPKVRMSMVRMLWKNE